ncbi:MAG: ArgR family transcriptional regulator [Deltaproteobacteria bacterium]|nr:ArgR family transcriptional regulator [Deltaproteobacteria bacterium]
MDKATRQRKITEIIRRSPVRNQSELVALLTKAGIESTQASVSRDLSDMGVVKVDGVYRAPQLEPGQSQLVDHLAAEKIGDHLIVVRTGPGHAQAVALHLDRAKLTGVAGTIAGDDTIFIALRSRDDQSKVMRKIFSIFKK